MTMSARIPAATQTGTHSHHVRWPLTRVLVLLLANAFVGLAMEIRVEHVDAVHEQGIAWTPIIYSCVMTIACLAATVFWSRTVPADGPAFSLVIRGWGDGLLLSQSREP